METPDPLQTFSQFLRAGNQFTDRDLMKALSVGHRALKQREADPSLFTMGELLLLAKLLNAPKLHVVKMVVAEMERNPQAAERLAEAAGQVVGRRNFPRAERPAKTSAEER